VIAVALYINVFTCYWQVFKGMKEKQEETNDETVIQNHYYERYLSLRCFQYLFYNSRLWLIFLLTFQMKTKNLSKDNWKKTYRRKSTPQKCAEFLQMKKKEEQEEQEKENMYVNTNQNVKKRERKKSILIANKKYVYDIFPTID
jgi:hypothetical protein